MDVCAATADDEKFLLDLLNTTPVIDGVHTDALPDLAGSAQWLSDHDVAATEQEWATLVDARASLQAVIRGDAAPTELHRFLSNVQLAPTMTADGVQWRLDGANGAARAVLAWDGLRITSPGRLRPCANTECHLFLIDRSKPNTARWCSMAICGNRMKARRHYQRSRG
ncbi:CGNR zinc finger domain-containing protein [Mycobacterium sp. 236(2023)]|uniref:CGNR zinc finger domain-containing protein n=1 Tax=Mycobacterium sp. 236(2023) TaxID=3038163 RepID=UPI0024150A33|nr:CGNR zinc finger domain-containing protein [Mycobacterium sp. 236(2023)]MDG4664150.1 CGNR zinc finger domain-containing protein [Mycobacterium sp. 236(2023)]